MNPATLPNTNPASGTEAAVPALEGAQDGVLCYTRRSPGSGTPLVAGVDTLKTIWHADPPPGRTLPFRIGRSYAKWFPARGRLEVEGTADDRHVTPVATIEARFREIEQAVARFGAEFAGVGRVDTTVDLQFPGDPASGREFLAALAAISLPRMKMCPCGFPTDGVTWTGLHSNDRKARAYDKSALYGAERFTVVRLEAQHLLTGGKRATLEALTTGEWLRARFAERFASILEMPDTVVVGALPQIARHLHEQARLKVIKATTFDRLLGTATSLSIDGGSAYSRSARYKREQDLRRHGIVLTEPWIQPVEFPLRGLIERALDPMAWGIKE